MPLPRSLYTGSLTEPAIGAVGHSFWLVKTPVGGSEVQDWGPGTQLGGPGGSKPTGTAVYLGPTVADVNRWIGAAAGRLGVPNPQIVPSLGTTIGIIGAEVGGFGAGAIAAADAAAVDAATGAGAAAEGAAATETGAGTTAADSAAGGAAGSGASTAAKKLAGAGFAGLFGSLSDWQQILVRGLQALVAIALLMLGLQAMTGTGDGNPITAARTVAKVVK